MKKLILLKLCILGGLLSAIQVESKATTLEVIKNSSSSISNTNFTATLDDGTILGFYIRYYTTDDYAYFSGSISQKTELSIPDSILFNSKRFAVRYCGSNNNSCDFENAQNVEELILPKTIEQVYYIPSTLNVLHLNNYVKSVNTNALSYLNNIFVPESDLSSYFENTSWSNYVLIFAEGAKPLKITVTMTKAGEFAQLLLQQTDNWCKVNELTVVGELNTNDLDVFKRMRQLTKLDLSQSVITEIPDNFDGSTSIGDHRQGFNFLVEVSLPELNRIGQYAFCNCRRLTTVSMPKVNKIGNAAFSRCGASQIILPEGITAIGGSAFAASQLEDMTIPQTVTEVWEKVFLDCKELEVVSILSPITIIRDGLFSGCNKLSSFSIPSTVTSIGKESFLGTGLTSIDLSGIKTIGESAFKNCKQLSNVTFTEGLTTIGKGSFSDCTTLIQINLPSTLLSVNDQTFGGCSNIKKVISRAVIPPTHTYKDYFLFKGCDMTDVKLYVPAMSIDSYRSDDNWKSFYTILPLEDKTSDAYIYDVAIINDAGEFADGFNMTIDYLQQNRTGSTQYYCGALDYNGVSTLSMNDYQQFHYLGRSASSNHYTYEAHFTSLIPNGPMKAEKVSTTVKTYNPSIWYFISLPYDVKVSDITYTEGTQFVIRKYSGQNRAQQSGDTWLNLTNNDIMNAYEGYILRCSKSEAVFTFPAVNNSNKNKIFEKESVVMPLGEYVGEFDHNRSWNLIGNPYPCYYDTRYMNFTAPITVWNRYNSRYDAYSPVDDSYILHPTQAFFVQRPVNQPSITFDKVGRQKDTTVHTLQSKEMKPAKIQSDRKVFNIIMNDETMEDHTRIVLNNDASCAYELDKDASKFITNDNHSMLVYTIENGVKYAINERPLQSGIIELGYFAPDDGKYKLSIETKANDNIILIDNETNTETVMTGSYQFCASAGYNNTRFTLIFGNATAIDSIDCDISANAPFTVYTIDGRLIGSQESGNTKSLSKGVYIIVNKNEMRKIVVK